ncbi:NAD(P)-dependent dehydrogenase (short-subunit alcohol dehydrogenase family) [Bradyrhizobium sp. USDA 4369]
MPDYITSKHGVIGLTKSVAFDYGSLNARCSAVGPSFVKTPMTLAGTPDPAIWDRFAQGHPMRRLKRDENSLNRFGIPKSACF